MKLALLMALGLASVSGQISGKRRGGRASNNSLKRSSRRPPTTFESASKNSLVTQSTANTFTSHKTVKETYYKSTYIKGEEIQSDGLVEEMVWVTEKEEVDAFKKEADTVSDDITENGIDFLANLIEYENLWEQTTYNMEAAAYSLFMVYEQKRVELTEAQQVQSDYEEDVRRARRAHEEAKSELSKWEIKYDKEWAEYQRVLIEAEYAMKEKLHAFRETWMMGITEQQMYLNMKPVARLLRFKLDEWEETTGACVDDVNFNTPDASHFISLPGNEEFIGRTQCAKLCRDDPNCTAFSAEHNDSETGQCIMLMDGPGVYTGDGPRDPGWHCHVNLQREADHKETYPEFPNDYEQMGAEEPDEENAAMLLKMINYMDMMV